jgi:hypothetical protein
MGYSLDDLLNQLDNARRPTPPLSLLDDAWRLASSAGRDAVKGIIPPHAGGPSTWRAIAAPRYDRRRRG